MLGTRLSISFQYVSVDVSILFGVVRGCCHRLFVAVTVDSYLLVTGTVFLKQIEVCNVGENFVHMWRICFFVVGALFVGFV